MSFFVWMVGLASAWAADAAVSLDVGELREGQSVGLSLVVRDAAVTTVPTIEVPDGLEVRFQSQAQSRTIINFESSVATTLRYALTARKRGTYTIPAVAVNTRDGVLRTSPVTVQVGARTSGGSESLTSTLSAPRAWVGQVLVQRIRFITERALVSASWGPPQAKGLTPEPTVQPIAREGQIEADGKPASVQELDVPLRAVSAGSHTLSGAILQAQFATARKRRGGADLLFEDLSRFGDVRAETFAADPLKVEVQALPAEGRPADFSGLVGAFALEAKAPASTLAVGETLTLEITLSGDGVLAGTTLPPVKLEGWRVYDDQPNVTAALAPEGTYRAAATFKRAYVPQSPGEKEIPPIVLSVFDPAAGAYRTLQTSPFRVTVTGSAGNAEVSSYMAPHKSEVAAEGEDILPFRAQASVSRPVPLSLAWTLLAPGGLLLLGQGARAVWARRKVAVAGKDRPTARIELPSDPEARLAAWEAALREAIGDKLGIPGGALRREDLQRLGPHAAEADAAWRALEAARYGDARGLPEAGIQALLEALA